jgi:hypothetical protein
MLSTLIYTLWILTIVVLKLFSVVLAHNTCSKIVCLSPFSSFTAFQWYRVSTVPFEIQHTNSASNHTDISLFNTKKWSEGTMIGAAAHH